MTNRRERWLALIVAALAGLVFAAALHGPWIFDDHQLIEGNPEVHSLSAAATWFTSDFWHGAGLASRLHYWRPLVSASFAVDWVIGGGGTVQFHLTNLLLHAAVASLVFFTLRRWAQTPWAAFAAATLWAVHPTKAENVAWIAGRTDILCLGFILVAAAGMHERLEGRRLSGLALEVLGTVGAYLSKEQAVVLPVFAAAEAWCRAGRPALDRALARSLLRAALPQTLIALAYVAVHQVLMPISTSGAAGLVDHARAVLQTYGRFVALTFAPHQLSMQHALVRPHDGSIVPSTPYEVLGAVALVATVAALVVLRRRWPTASVGLAIFLVTLAPTLNLALTNQQTLVAERFLYVPTLGLALVLATALAAIPAHARRRAQLLVAAIALALGALALSRAADFGDEDAFWNRELRLHPESPAGLEYVISTPIQKAALAQIAAATQRDTDPATFAADALEIFVHAISDRDPIALRVLDTGAAALLQHRAPVARLDALGLTAVVDMGPGFVEHLPAVAARIHAARAELAARGGDPVAARAAAAAESRACGGCEHARLTIALTEARAAALGPPAEADAGFAHALELAGSQGELAQRIGQARRAAATTRTAAGILQLQARASELSTLGLWGAAYKVVRPRFAEIARLPHAAPDLARLAFRAGYAADAAQALASEMAGAQIRTTLEDWARERGWSPPVTSAGGPSSP